jgi:hypothetical protein
LIVWLKHLLKFRLMAILSRVRLNNGGYKLWD